MQGRKDTVELLHDWALTNIRFQAGKRVRTPPMYHPTPETAEDRKQKLLESLRGALSA